MTSHNFQVSSIDDRYLRPFGASDFSELVRAYNANKELPFIDKTKMIESLFSHQDSIILFTRPRRFGKSTNISMLHYFLGVPEARPLFEPLAIGKNKQIMDEQQGAYSVISLSFKSLKAMDYEDFIAKLKLLIQEIYLSFRFILHPYLNDPKNNQEAIIFEQITSLKADNATLASSLRKLSMYLSEACKKPVWILIDEYDAPIHEAFADNYYPQLIKFMRSFLGNALKDNRYLRGGIITGILRIAKEGFFSDLNNLVVDSIFNYDYAPYFGFTPEEVQLLLAQKGIIASASEPIPEDVLKWYNGYKIGETFIYNPWSILCYLKNNWLKPYWVNTGSDLLLRDFLTNSSHEFPEKLKLLLLDEPVKEFVSENLEYSTLKNDPEGFWSLLISSGYLKIRSPSRQIDFDEPQELAIPNYEIRYALKNLARSIFNSAQMKGNWFRKALQRLLEEGQTEAFFEGLQKILQINVSYHDVGIGGENFYHGLLLGIIATLQSSHRVLSNRESGHGRYDLAVIPNHQTHEDLPREKKKLRVLLFEIKRVPWIKGRNEEEMELLLQETAQKALDQIEEKDYLSEFRQNIAEEVIAIGIAFCGKLFYGQERVYQLT